MIPALGVMIAVIGGVVCLYVIVRCAEIVGGESPGGTKLLAATTAVAALGAVFVIVLMTIDIVNLGTEAAQGLQGLSR